MYESFCYSLLYQTDENFAQINNMSSNFLAKIIDFLVNNSFLLLRRIIRH